MTQYISLAFFLLAVVIAAALGAQFEAGAWYQALNKPSLTPPDWAYGPIWAVIYLLMALAAWRVWNSGRSNRNGALAWWLIILALNVAWSWMMFGLNRPGWVMGLSIILLGLSIMCARAFSLVARPAGLMLVPLVGWLAFVVFFNYNIWAMNGGGLGRFFS
jgi:benzodiazapine receptor